MAHSTILRRTEIGSVVDPADPALSEIFHENTKLHDVKLPNAQPPLAQYAFEEMAAMSGAGKIYPGLPRVSLAPAEQAAQTFPAVLRQRRSVRAFGSAPMSFEALSWVLDLSYGVTSESAHGGFVQRYRAAPSAGALYPAEIYLYARNVVGLPQGLYHYSPVKRAVARICAGDLTADVRAACARQDYVRQAAVTIFITGVFERTRRKYGERGYRYALLDIGHLGQNLCLAATAAGVAIMTTCGFFDDDVNRLLGVDGLDEAAAYVAFLGPKADDQAGDVRTD